MKLDSENMVLLFEQKILIVSFSWDDWLRSILSPGSAICRVCISELIVLNPKANT